MNIQQVDNKQGQSKMVCGLMAVDTNEREIDYL